MRTCKWCGTREGFRHSDSCPVHNLIDASVAYESDW